MSCSFEEMKNEGWRRNAEQKQFLMLQKYDS